jgi:hypothetical protein
MTDPLASWQQRDLDRQAARQRNQVDTAKLLVTFSVGAAAAVAASALQVGRSGFWDVTCISLLGWAFVLALVVVLLDRTTAVDRDSLFAEARQRGWNDDTLLLELTMAESASAANNEHVAAAVKRVSLMQVVFALLSAVSGSISLLGH